MQKNALRFLFDNAFSSAVYWAAAGTVLASLAGYYELPLWLSNALLGLTTVLPLAQLAGAPLYRRQKQPLRYLYVMNITWRVLLPAAYLGVLLPAAVGRVFSLVTYALGVLLNQICSPVQTDWMVNEVSNNMPHNYYARRETTFMLTYTSAFCVVNLFLARGQAHSNTRLAYATVGVFLALMAAVSMCFLFRLPHVLPAQRRGGAPMPVRAILRDARFRPVLALGMIWSFFTMLIGNYASLYQVRIAKIDFITMMVWITAANLLRALLTPVAGRKANRFGWNGVVGFCMLLYACAGVLWSAFSASSGVWVYPLATILGTIAYAGIGVGVFQFQLWYMPHTERSACFAVYAACCGVASVVGTTVCSGLIGVTTALGWDPRLPFLPGALGALLSAAMAFRMHTPGRVDR